VSSGKSSAGGERPAPLAGPLDRVLRALNDGMSWGAARRMIESGKVSIDGRRELDPTAPVAQGATIAVSMAAPKPRAESPVEADDIIYLDGQVVVVRKPAGVSTVPYDEHETGTLSELVHALLKRRGGPVAELGVVHRIDKETSGLVLFARTLAAKRALKQQFRFHSVERRYVALAHGAVRACTHQSRLVQDRGDGRRGSTDNPILGRDSVTHVTPLEALAGATLVECRLETGRTHQIRIHLAEAGHPLVGERVYGRDYRGARIEAPRLMLHAFELGFEHPSSGKPLHFEEPMPEDMERVVRGLRQRASVGRPVRSESPQRPRRRR
jgi:23S rRNA pseudouridine1911/1915/1917 synthase